jgi:hypothetical protein
MLQHAYKEWAVICEALGRGDQSLLLHQAGTDEGDPAFLRNEAQFWLFPTFSQQQQTGIIEDAKTLLQQVETDRPPSGTVRVQYWAEITTIYRVREALPAVLLAHLHYYSEETVLQRLEAGLGGVGGLYVLVVRVWKPPRAVEIAEAADPASRPCWVELAQPLSTENSTPALDDDSFRIVQKQLDMLLSPTASA